MNEPPAITMTLWEAITRAREAFVQGYLQTLQAQQEKLAGLAPESLVGVNGAHDLPPDYRFFRADLVWRESDGQPRLGTLRAGALELAGPIEVVYPDGGQVTVTSFRWDDCMVITTPAITDDQRLRQWLRHWIDRDEQFPPTGNNLRGAIHSLTPPQLSQDHSASLLAVDFGSAPPEAVTQLISTLFASGAQSIRIGDLPGPVTGNQ